MSTNAFRPRGDIVALRYITTDGRIEMCWPCRVVEDNESVLALFIAAGSRYKAGPKRTAVQKLTMQRIALPPEEYIWRTDTLRLMFPRRRHSVWLSWEGAGVSRRFSKYFVNLEEPFRRTPVGFDTQDHTLDIEVMPDLSWQWRDVEEFDEHVKHGFFSANLANEVRDEGKRVIEEITGETHPCLDGWSRWTPDAHWDLAEVPRAWSLSPVTLWEKHHRAYGRLGGLRRKEPE